MTGYLKLRFHAFLDSSSVHLTMLATSTIIIAFSELIIEGAGIKLDCIILLRKGLNG